MASEAVPVKVKRRTSLTTQITIWGIAGLLAGLAYGGYAFTKSTGTFNCAIGTVIAYGIFGFIGGVLLGATVTLVYNLFVETRDPELIKRELVKSRDYVQRKLEKELERQKALRAKEKELRDTTGKSKKEFNTAVEKLEQEKTSQLEVLENLRNEKKELQEQIKQTSSPKSPKSPKSASPKSKRKG